jgi:antitoxin component HigA of HigAB toxin-antitoxin module
MLMEANHLQAADLIDVFGAGDLAAEVIDRDRATVIDHLQSLTIPRSAKVVHPNLRLRCWPLLKLPM